MTGMADFAQGAPDTISPLSQSAQQNQPAKFTEEFDPGQQESSTLGGDAGDLRRNESVVSQSHTLTPSRGGTLKKKRSLSRKGSVKRTGSKKGSRPGSVRSLGLGDQEDYTGEHGNEMNSAFFTPVPTSGNPTEILANRFQSWRKVLKDLITYFRDIQKTYETRSKSLYTLSNVIGNITTPSMFLAQGGISDATQILQTYHKKAISEGNKAKTIEDDVVVQLTGLRSDLQQKVKEIKSLSGDFKNNVEKETEATRRAVQDLQAALGLVDTDPSATSGKGDPFIVKTAVDRQLLRQIDEENYLHRAFLNLESSGRELESIVVGEIQKAYNAYAGVLKREADEAYDAVERLQSGPLAMAKDHEWDAFVDRNEHFVDPRLPVRRIENITYPGIDNPAAAEVKSGMLERKSKYLKSYTPGWYVLSPTHLHEFKSPDRIMSQAPVMSLYLADQKLGSHSGPDSSSHKFMLKGRQTGGVHRGHAWVFRAESYDTMLAWFEDIKNLTEKTGEERTAFIRQHARSVSAGSNKAPSVSDDGALDEDEADQVPYSATASQIDQPVEGEKRAERPVPGGRFPSALTVDRDSQIPRSPSSPSSSGDRDIVAAAGALPGSGVPFGESGHQVQSGDDETNARGELGGPSGAVPQQSSGKPTDAVFPTKAAPQQNTYIPAGHTQEHNGQPVSPVPVPLGGTGSEYNTKPVQAGGVSSDGPGAVSYGAPPSHAEDDSSVPRSFLPRHDSKYGDWMGPAAAGAGGLALGAGGVEAYKHHQEQKKEAEQKALAENQAKQERIGSQPGQNQNQSNLPPSQVSPQPVPPADVSAQSIAAAHTSNSKSTSQPLPPNVAWATSSSSSVIDANQIHSDDVTPTSGSNVDPFSPSSGLSPVSEQSSNLVTGNSKRGDPGAPIKALARPPLESHASVATISDLHIPGEFPRVKPGEQGGF